jgi:hypothetical protein
MRIIAIPAAVGLPAMPHVRRLVRHGNSTFNGRYHAMRRGYAIA